jgi:hypothetical protein
MIGVSRYSPPIVEFKLIGFYLYRLIFLSAEFSPPFEDNSAALHLCTSGIRLGRSNYAQQGQLSACIV